MSREEHDAETGSDYRPSHSLVIVCGIEVLHDANKQIQF